MSDGMKTVNLIEKVLDYECSVDDAITIETMMFKNMRTEIERLTAELDRYKQGVEMDGEVRCILLAKSEGTCGKAQIIIPIIPIDDSILIGNRVRVLVMPMEDKN